MSARKVIAEALAIQWWGPATQQEVDRFDEHVANAEENYGEEIDAILAALDAAGFDLVRHNLYVAMGNGEEWAWTESAKMLEAKALIRNPTTDDRGEAI